MVARDLPIGGYSLLTKSEKINTDSKNDASKYKDLVKPAHKLNHIKKEIGDFYTKGLKMFGISKNYK